MRKVYLFAGMAAMLLASCSSNDRLDTGQTVSQKPVEQGGVGFDAYLQRATTRAGEAGEMNLERLRQTGFGVFGYYTDNNDYDQQRIPDFMYNQYVYDNTPTAANAEWTYEPVKFWPNEYGSTAISDDNDKVSFFAYAPYVQVIASSGKLASSTTTNEDAKWGIAGLSRNSATGDPLVKYIVSFDQDKSVDLMWGVCDDPMWSIIEGGTKQKINDGVPGKPWVNVQRPQTVDQRLRFTFKHALSQLKVNVDAFVDGYDNTNPLPDELGNRTRIFIRQISFTGFALKGALNLNNSETANQAYWLDFNGSTDLESGESVVIYDGRKDGKEGAAGSAASNEKTLGLNPQFVQDAEWKSGDMASGVTNVPASLFRKLISTNPDKYGPSDAPLMVIPTGEDIEVEIVYDVETADDNLATYLSDKKEFGSSIENRIRKEIKFGDANFESGKCYTINLHLGMNSVKLDAEVSPWEEAGVSPDIHLPSNMPTFAASASSTAAEYTSDAAINDDITEYIFAVSGLNGGESVTADVSALTGATATVSSKADFNGNAGVADVTGIAYIKVTGITPNKDVKNVTTADAIKVTGNASGKKRYISLTQLAHPLGMTIASLSADGKQIKLSTSATMSAKTNWQVQSSGSTAADYSVEVLKNGTALTKQTATPLIADGQFQFDTENEVIKLYTSAVPGDVYTITVKTGDVQKETVQAKVGGIEYEIGTVHILYGSTGLNPLTKSGMTNITYASSKTDHATVAADGTVTGVGIGSSRITATGEAESGYFVASNTAEYILWVDKAVNSTISAADNTNLTVSQVNGYELSNIVKLLNANGDELEAGDAATAKAGKVTYTLVDAPVAAGAQKRVKIQDGKIVKSGTAGVYTPVVGDVYRITAAVDAASNENVEYATGKDSKTITITVVAD